MTIAGSDPSGGAGIQADLKTFTLLGCYGQAVPSALTIQNTLGVKRCEPLAAELVDEQARAVLDDWMPDAVKLGLLPTAEVMMVMARLLSAYRPKFVVLDPVMISSSGRRLMAVEAERALRKSLLPLCTLVTPNLAEYEALSGRSSEAFRTDAEAVSWEWGGLSILLKGGHRKDSACDVLYHEGHFFEFDHSLIASVNTHGTGCVLSSAIAATVAKGRSLPEAVGEAKAFLCEALIKGADYEVGHGAGAMYLIGRTH